MPQGNYLLVQAGKQLEHITGGLVKAGFHEVVVNEATLEVCFLLARLMFSRIDDVWRRR